MYATEVIDNRTMSGVTMVTVYVINENDNTPTFDNITYEASVPENANPGAFVEIVREINLVIIVRAEFSK